MVRRPVEFLPLFLVGALVCTDGPTGTGAFNISRGRTLWRQHGFSDYDFTLTQGCFCGFVGRARVQVRDGEAVSITEIGSGDAIPLELLRIRTVEHAFDVIQSFLEDEGDRSVEVRFHDRLGFPLMGNLDIARIADEELHFEIEDLEPAD